MVKHAKQEWADIDACRDITNSLNYRRFGENIPLQSGCKFQYNSQAKDDERRHNVSKEMSSSNKTPFFSKSSNHFLGSINIPRYEAQSEVANEFAPLKT